MGRPLRYYDKSYGNTPQKARASKFYDTLYCEVATMFDKNSARDRLMREESMLDYTE